ncbi:hypothetical protein MNBD_ACTINO01-1839, partial [hydrothermal vent metagenome]
MLKHPKTIALIGAIALIAAACSSAGSPDTTDGGAASDDAIVSTTSGDTSTTTAASAVGAGALPEGPSALDDRFNDAFPDPLID